MNLEDLADRQITRARSERERNRAKFPHAAAWLDCLRDAGVDARITYATNAAGETIGESFPARCDREWMVECLIHWRGVR